MKVKVLQGPNLHALGQREAHHYGSFTLSEVEHDLNALASELGIGISHLQSNHEGVLVDAVHEAQRDRYDGILLNAAAYTHTSVALRDALLATSMPFVEVHISNVHAREAFRKKSLLADVAVGVVTGFGKTSYALGLRGLINSLRVRGCN